MALKPCIRYSIRLDRFHSWFFPLWSSIFFLLWASGWKFDINWIQLTSCCPKCYLSLSFTSKKTVSWHGLQSLKEATISGALKMLMPSGLSKSWFRHTNYAYGLCFMQVVSHQARVAARILHGLSSPQFPAKAWSKCGFWGRYSDVSFATVLGIARRQCQWIFHLPLPFLVLYQVLLTVKAVSFLCLKLR